MPQEIPSEKRLNNLKFSDNEREPSRLLEGMFPSRYPFLPQETSNYVITVFFPGCYTRNPGRRKKSKLNENPGCYTPDFYVLFYFRENPSENRFSLEIFHYGN